MNADALLDAGAPGFDDPLGMMYACHGRMRRLLRTLERLQRHLPEHGCDADAQAAARAVLRYFDHAAPNHHADEEQSLFPRLLAVDPKEVAPVIRDLERDHALLERRWQHLRPLLAGIAAGVRANLSPREVAGLSALYDTHIAKEESTLLPLAEQSLDPSALATLGAEMAARRGVSPTPKARASADAA